MVQFGLKPSLRLTPGGYLFDGATADTYTLNPTGQCVMGALLAGESCESSRLAAKLMAAFDVSEHKARRDVREFLIQLRQLRLLVENAALR